MAKVFSVVLPSKPEKQAKNISRGNKLFIAEFKAAISILKVDPFNLSREHKIKKLTDEKEGVWRIRFGDYRVRYDIDGSTVIINRVQHRKDVYK